MAKKPSIQHAPVAQLPDAERERRNRLASLGLRKESAGQILTRDEATALNAWREAQRAEHGEAYLAAMPKKDVSRFTGRQSKVLLEMAMRYGLPYDRHASAVDGRKWMAFITDFLALHGRALLGVDGTEGAAMAAATGPLKDELVRKCIEKTEIANEKARLELCRLKEEFVPIEPIRQYHNELAALVHQLSEAMGRRDTLTGTEAQEMVAELADSFAKAAHNVFGDGSEDPKQENVPAPEATGSVAAGVAE